MLEHLHGRVLAATPGLLLIMLGGCGSEPPGCADPKTVSLVREGFWNTVAKSAVDANDKALLALARTKFDVELLSPRVTEKQSDAAKVICSGTLRVALSEGASKNVPSMFKRENVAEVEYSSQLTADEKEQVVQLAGQANGAAYVWSLVKMGAFNAPK